MRLVRQAFGGGLWNLPQNGGKFGCFYIETIPEAIGFLNSSIQYFTEILR
jgi:hypothetical protein